MRSDLSSIKYATAAAIIAFFAVTLFFLNPEVEAVYPQCLFYKVTGLPCNGCGLLRAAHSLLHGEVHRALSFNPLVFVASPLFAMLALRPSFAQSRFIVTCALLVSLSFFIARITGILPLPTT